MAEAKALKQKLVNRQRATRIAKVMATHPQYDLAVEHVDAIVDVLTDLRHLCDKRGDDFANLNRIAHDNYLAELDPHNIEGRRN